MKEFPRLQKEHLFPLEMPFLVTSEDIPKILDKLMDTDFYQHISVATRFHIDEPHKRKWEIKFFAESEECLRKLTAQIASIMSIVWYGADFTPKK